ncbi:hypothetical protein KAFR_0C04200 [Kazachstania africana CBS 2517]|uniref:C2H2-type domain-containing protein n=1 Tax=Kazachstania africana (strain ATCC 22294 / BCRC 22015 / CBS 2517 / CECT 1963 / NBRC 1671 / NRRL Y-8276) TaxID=1071382 RepID=H2ASR1_KAZAF|nr:hypothetical protein KAFR_0C04200 [Kazachstania africana CBS 2517]CCF57411.1 hypothetical protein KAFR_0C04200 [Kazachstania africana CBS 2517]
MSGMYTCNSCALQFESGPAQREHMKSDWHRYNLKRRVADLPPISYETFNSKVASANAQAKESQNSGKQLTKKEIRRREKEALLEKKRQLLELARQSMLKNMQNAQEASAPEATKEEAEPLVDVAAEKKAEEEKEKEGPNEEELTEEQLAEKLMATKLANKVDIPLEQCLFCSKNKTFRDFETNLDHMFKSHGFYIPEQKYLVDKEGLVKYMSEKIGLGNVCIVCNYQGRSLEAVRAHMLDKRHCKIPYEVENEKLEISEFYDFTSTYDQFKDHKEQAHIVVDKSGKTTFNKDNDDEDEWEDVSGTEEGDDEEEELPSEYLYNDGIELHLPSGVKVGHRSLQRYYRQNLKPEKEWTEGQGTLIAAETRSFLTTFDRKEVQVQKLVWQTEVKDKKRHDKRSAKFINNQPYYRDQLLQ